MPRFTISQRTTEPLLKAERPYEDMSINFMTVLRIAGEWRMWYGAYDHTYRDDNDAYLCYATSPDGLHWERPNLGVVAYGGNTANNILIDGRKTGGMHGITVFVDEAAPSVERYKMVFVRGETAANGVFGWYVHGATSADGIEWRILPLPLLRQNSDSQTVCFHDGDVYRLYVRQWTTGLFQGVRVVGYSESRTFGDFPEPVQILAPEAHDPADMHFYNSAATKLDDGLYVMFPSAYYTGDQTVRPHLAVSRDGRRFERVGRGVAVPPGVPGTFDSKSIYVAPGAVPGAAPNTWWFYYAGYNIGHDGTQAYAGGYGRFLLTVE